MRRVVRPRSRLVKRKILYVGLLGIALGIGYTAARPDIVRLSPSSKVARSRMELFFQDELARLNLGNSADAATIARWCTTDLRHLLAIEDARAVAFHEAYFMDQPGRIDILKPPFADSGCFIDVGLEGRMAANLSIPIRRGDSVEIPVSFSSTEGGHTYDKGSQTMIVRYENGDWRIADITFSDGYSLTQLLQRPKYMQLPNRK